MVSKQNFADNDQYENLFESQNSFSLNEISSKTEKEAQEYFDETNFDFFLKELTKILICKKNQNVESNFYQGVQWFIKGQHVYLKPFSYIIKNKYNKVCFLQNIRNLWSNKAKTFKKFTANDFCQLIILICNDIPFSFLLDVLKVYSNYNILDDQDLLDQKVNFDDPYRIFCFLLYYSDYINLVREAFKATQKLKALDSKMRISKESLLRFMCNFSENPEINEINKILFLEGKDEYSEQKDTDYADFIQNLIQNDQMFRDILDQFSFYEREMEKYEKLKKIALDGL